MLQASGMLFLPGVYCCPYQYVTPAGVKTLLITSTRRTTIIMFSSRREDIIIDNYIKNLFSACRQVCHLNTMTVSNPCLLFLRTGALFPCLYFHLPKFHSCRSEGIFYYKYKKNNYNYVFFL